MVMMASLMIETRESRMCVIWMMNAMKERKKGMGKGCSGAVLSIQIGKILPHAARCPISHRLRYQAPSMG
jgi:hypothetical protein